MNTIKQKIIIILFLMVSSTNLFSQYIITGNVIDSENSPLANANVVILDKASRKIITGTVSDEKGLFQIPIKNHKQLLISITYIGFENWEKDITGDRNQNLGNIILKASTDNIDEVSLTVRKKMIIRKQDKLVFSVQNSPLKKGYEVIDLFKITPYVWVNPDDSVLIRGEQATIMVNGREVENSYLLDISSDDIKEIEVQTNQTAKSSATTTGGIINIILKKKERGFSGNLNSSYTCKRKGNNLFSGLSMYYGNAKWDFYSSYNFGRSNYFSETINQVQFLESQKSINTNTEKWVLSNSNNVKLGFVNQLNKKHKIGIELAGRYFNSHDSSLGRADYLLDNFQLDEGDIDVSGHAISKAFAGVINYKWMLSKNHSLNVFIDYYNRVKKDDNNTKTFYNNHFYTNNENRYNSAANIEVKALQIDYSKVLKNKINVDFGVKYTDTDRYSSLLSKYREDDIFITDTTQTTDAKYNEKISAVYLSANKKIKEKNYVKIGLRIENTDVDKEDFLKNSSFIKNYTDYFPSFYFSRTIFPKKTISLSYSRSLRRPNFSLLSEEVDKVNDFQYYVGNPYLNPEFTNYYDINYEFNKQSLSVYLKSTKDKITEIYTVNDDIAYFKTVNLGTQKRYGIEYSLRKKINKWWFISLSSYVYNEDFVNKQGQNQFLMTTYGGRIFSKYTINKNTGVDLSGFYRSPSASAYYKSYAIHSVNLSLKKSFLNKNLNIRIDFNDILNTFTYQTLREFETFNAYYQRKPNRQAIRVKLSYTFSNRKTIRKEKNKSKNEIKMRL